MVCIRERRSRWHGSTSKGSKSIESRRYYSHLVLEGNRGGPSVCEAARDLKRAVAKTRVTTA